jgi:hypothetical protein
MPTLLRPWGRVPATIRGTVSLGQPGPFADGAPAASFNGTGGVVVGQIATASPSALTKEVWVYLSEAQSLTTIMDFGMAGTTAAIYLEPYNNSWMAGCAVSSGGNAFNGTSEELYYPWTLNAWTYLVQVVTPTTMQLWVNAQLVAQASGLSFRLNISQAPLYFGAQRGNLVGSLAGGALYFTALSSGQIAAHYAAAGLRTPGAYTAAILADQPASYWPFDDASGPWLHDRILQAA